MDDRDEPVRHPPANLDKILRAVGGERTLLKRILVTFLEDYPEKLAHIRGALQTSDAQALERAAHSYRGALVLLGAEDACCLSAKLEELGESGALNDAGALARELEAETARLVQFLSEEAGLSSKT